ncbi:MAG: L-seryl-tRNA(Sec) selenium transferase [Planctomycetota bacterium]|nr:MAG: L-seryl-tRNA(Sec) selenium transferase [Planctomycetota bacterium]
MTEAPFRQIPSVDRLVRMQGGVPSLLASTAARSLVAAMRSELRDSWPPLEGEKDYFSEQRLCERLARLRQALSLPYHRRVLNATGILLHTGLGRAPLAEAAQAALLAASGAALTEVSPSTGKRSKREEAVAALLCDLTGAEAGLVLNNNAAATMLALDATARGREVPISRGELVEIGGGYRMPDVMECAGCLMVEIGTTNRTRLRDYAGAIGENTGALLKVHPSNYRIEGFSESVELADLVALGREHGIPVIEDLGSGLMLSGGLPGDPREPSTLDSVQAGADLVCVSGDKLLGGPQAGIIVGRAEAVARVRAHPLYRAMRCSKLALSALEATLRIYRYGDPKREIPVQFALWREPAELRVRAEELLAAGKSCWTKLGYAAEIQDTDAFVGSGASPARPVASLCVVLRSESRKLEEDLRVLREGDPSVWARLEDGAIYLDMRSLAEGAEEDLLASFARLD